LRTGDFYKPVSFLEELKYGEVRLASNKEAMEKENLPCLINQPNNKGALS
jgi:hypothetical protein